MRRSLRPALALATLTLALTALLAACGGGATAPDGSAPSLTITSKTTATSATYHLTGTTSDNVGATKITYSVNGGPTQTVDLTGGTFDVTITLKAGQNTIDVTVYDAAGNKKTATLTVTYTPPTSTTGTLTVTVQNLPSGTPANIAVTGPSGYNQNVTATATLTGLAPGTYTVNANNVTSGGSTYQPDKSSQTVSLSAGQTKSVSVAYSAASTTTGSLTLTLAGLLNGTPAKVDVTGPTTVSSPVTASTTLNGLAPGTYTITPHDVTGAHYDYAAPAQTTATVTAGGTVTTTVTYTVTTGGVTLDVLGLPTSTSAGVTLTGSGGPYTVDATTTLDHLQPGTYTLSTHQLKGSDSELYDDKADSFATVTVQVGTTPTKKLQFIQVSGDLTVTVTGVASGSVDVVQPNPSYNAHVTVTTTLKGLWASATGTTYYVSANDVTANGYDWKGTVASGTATNPVVKRGQTAQTQVTYQAIDGALDLTFSGLPTGTAGKADLLDPSGNTLFSNLSSRVIVDYLTPGTYTVVVHSVRDLYYAYGYNGSSTDPTSFPVTVNAGQRAKADASYKAFTGVLDVTVTSSSSTLTPDVTVSGTNNGTPYSKKVSILGMTSLAFLDPGSFTVAAANVTGSRYHYHPTPVSASYAVSAGSPPTFATVDYQPTDGAISVSFSGPIPTGQSYSAKILNGGTTYATVSGNTLLAYVPAANYTVTATTYKPTKCVSGTTQTIYSPTITTTPSPLSLTPGVTATVSVAYTATKIQCP